MSDVTLRIALFILLLLLPILWTITTPSNFLSFLKTFHRPEHLLMTFYQVLPFFQILGIIRISWQEQSTDNIIVVIGIMLLIIGLIFAGWAKLVMKENWGRPGEHDIRTQTHLVTTGPFQLARNPIYLGLLLVFVGVELALRSYLVVLAIPLYFGMMAIIKREEQLLALYFGKGFFSYQRQVPRFFPFLTHSTKQGS